MYVTLSKAFDNKAIPKQCIKIFLPLVSDNLGNLFPVKKPIEFNIRAAKDILMAAIVSG